MPKRENNFPWKNLVIRYINIVLLLYKQIDVDVHLCGTNNQVDKGTQIMVLVSITQHNEIKFLIVQLWIQRITEDWIVQYAWYVHH